MPNTETDTDKIRTQIANRLEDAGLSTERFVSLEPGQKRPDQKWRERDRPHTTVAGNYGVKCGDGLVILDVDDHKPDVVSPEELDDLPPTFTTESCHSGSHLWFHVKNGEIESAKPTWGDVQSQGTYIVGPGSEVHGTRDGADCSYENCCTVNDPGVYELVVDRPIATISVDRLTAIPGVEETRDEPTRRVHESTVGWVETADPIDINGLPDNFEPDEVTNEIGMTLADVRDVSYRLNKLVDSNERLNPENRYESISEADMNAADLLYGWRFEPDDISMILRACRDRENRDSEKPMKMRRDDYAPRTVAKAEMRVVEQIDPEFAWALLNSAQENNGHGPKASRWTLEVTQWGIFEAFLWTGWLEVSTTEVAETPRVTHDWALPSTEWSESTDEARHRRVRRALHILADAGLVKRRQQDNGSYRWKQAGSETVFGQMFKVKELDEKLASETFGVAAPVAAD